LYYFDLPVTHTAVLYCLYRIEEIFRPITSD
jgi:hypothetical protein